MAGFHHLIADNLHYDLIVPGSGPAGQNTARGATDHSARVLIVEQELHIGGLGVQYGPIRASL